VCRLGRARHASFRDTFRQAWPDIVDSPGGLRDLRLVSGSIGSIQSIVKTTPA